MRSERVQLGGGILIDGVYQVLVAERRGSTFVLHTKSVVDGVKPDIRLISPPKASRARPERQARLMARKLARLTRAKGRG